MTQEELRQRLIELVEQPMPMMCGTVTYGEMRMPEYQARFIVNNLIANGVTIRERGEWVSKGEGVWECSHCKEEIIADAYGDIHPADDCGWVCCPVCGSDLRGVKDE